MKLFTQRDREQMVWLTVGVAIMVVYIFVGLMLE